MKVEVAKEIATTTAAVTATSATAATAAVTATSATAATAAAAVNDEGLASKYLYAPNDKQGKLEERE
ncbi:hypothetical protein HZH68_014015 [Vespula germanica]|uniref:Uncharacterized protein n=1 Tax=Vespula germanica TaxID=30212 RepID=A0A834JCN3_VESGE|nr:hypothetical protein HZH68_014015 [Vespula germanica]